MGSVVVRADLGLGMLALLIITHGDGDLGLDLAFVTFGARHSWAGLGPVFWVGPSLHCEQL